MRKKRTKRWRGIYGGREIWALDFDDDADDDDDDDEAGEVEEEEEEGEESNRWVCAQGVRTVLSSTTRIYDDSFALLLPQ